ncbi:aldo/keto reductase [Streptomyces phaeochromogenes]|uniref:aldo/keto reductase n=1 Tax=Streptomyces phaeochromogenes TaxID=1923 RepID=UPI00325458BA
MQRRILGGTGISVSEYALGAMMFGEIGNPDHDDSVRIIHAALEAGINFVDTADIYSTGESEEIVGKALKGRREEVVLATKFRLPMGDEPNLAGGSRRYIMRAVEDSLRRLDTDYIDLYQMHRPDPLTDIDETLSALSDLVRSGKVRVVGSSSFPADQIVEAQWTAERRGHVRFRTEQPPYSILARGAEGSILPAAQRYGMGTLTWGPLSAGWLSGRDLAASGRAKLEGFKFDPALPGNAAKLAAVADLKKVAADAGLPLPHLALAFVRAHPGVTSAIIGPRTMDQLTSLLEGADVTLDDAILDRIDEIVPPGTDLNRADNYFVEQPALTDPALRRRP